MKEKESRIAPELKRTSRVASTITQAEKRAFDLKRRRLYPLLTISDVIREIIITWSLEK